MIITFFVVINNNLPNFTESDYTKEAFEKYSELDNLSRCGVAFACLGIETLPQEERGEIGMIKPSTVTTGVVNQLNIVTMLSALSPVFH